MSGLRTGVLHVGIDASGLVASKPATGLERYLGSLVAALPQASPDLSLHLYFSMPVPPAARAPGTILSRVPPGERVRWRVAPLARGWHRIGMGLAMRLDRLDVFHFPVPLMADYCPVPAVVTVHDLAALTLEPEQTRKERLYVDAALDAGRRATGLIAVSEATRDQIREHVGREAVVIPEGVDLTRFRAEAAQNAAARQRYGLERYILCAGTIQARKNHIRLIQAFEQIAERIPHTLVIAGRDGSGTEALDAYLAAHPNARVRRIGYIPESDLAALYAGADALALVSLWEGFGLPLLEAMACGVPVVTSNVSALVEIAGDAAVTVDPRDVGSIADALLRVLTDAELRERLIAAGIERAQAFSWDAAARRTVEVYRAVAGR